RPCRPRRQRIRKQRGGIRIAVKGRLAVLSVANICRKIRTFASDFATEISLIISAADFDAKLRMRDTGTAAFNLKAGLVGVVCNQAGT
ncbi:hypothetical protein, partial [Mesorhizobium sp.]|uniref:hypothetical protein n=1 Tax=Mesorhizobium sp. TaxID=1871066 RepID=UPI0025CF0996